MSLANAWQPHFRAPIQRGNSWQAILLDRVLSNETCRHDYHEMLGLKACLCHRPDNMSIKCKRSMEWQSSPLPPNASSFCRVVRLS